MEKRHILYALAFNLILAALFFRQHRNANVADISSDLSNIIPVCMKQDQPDAFRKDLYLSNPDDTRYYTPVYVQTLRALTWCCGGDYFAGLNLLSAITHLLYGFLWFLFFYAISREFWLSMLFSLFMRGVIWPPGGELLGISDLWTIMPRTLYAALMPLPFLVFRTRFRFPLFWSGLVLGLLVNLHPISGIGGMVAYFGAYLYYGWSTGTERRRLFTDLFSAVLGCLIGMLPYVLVYAGNVKAQPFDQAGFELAFHKRIPKEFFDPVLFLKSWNRPILYFFALFTLLFAWLDDSASKWKSRLLLCSIALLLLSANLSVYAERALNGWLHSNLRFSFQLIRYQKFILVLMQVATFLLVLQYVRKFRFGPKMQAGVFAMFLLVAGASKSYPMASLPLVGDDMVTSILPNDLMLTPRPKYLNIPDRLGMIRYIKDHTPKDAVFFGHHLIRAGAGRSVVLDMKGASMLIEGNQARFTQWYRELDHLEKLDRDQQPDYLKTLGVDYMMTRDTFPKLIPEARCGETFLYRLR